MAGMHPPPQYDHLPTIPVIENVMSFDEVQRQCAHIQVLVPGQFFNGCARIENGKCYVWRVDYEATRRHELAHCNGWPKEHPGGW